MERVQEQRAATRMYREALGVVVEEVVVAVVWLCGCLCVEVVVVEVRQSGMAGWCLAPLAQS